jgi:hypothetical protein
MIGLQNKKKAAEVSLGGLASNEYFSSWLGSPPGRQFDVARHMPLGNRAAKRTIDRAIVRKRGARLCFRYLTEQRHDFAKVTAPFKFVKKYFI